MLRHNPRKNWIQGWHESFKMNSAVYDIHNSTMSVCVFTTSNDDKLKNYSVVNIGFYVACNVHDNINISRCFGKVVSKSNSSKPAGYKGTFQLSISHLISMPGSSKHDLRFSPYDQIVEVLLLHHLLASNFWKVSKLISIQRWRTSLNTSGPGFF